MLSTVSANTETLTSDGSGGIERAASAERGPCGGRLGTPRGDDRLAATVMISRRYNLFRRSEIIRRDPGGIIQLTL